jgi:hypothetical protein
MPAQDDLLALVPPPAGHPFAYDWNLVEREMGTPLPADYKWLAEMYGPGEFDDMLTIHAPSTRGSPTDLVSAAREQADIMRSIREDLLEGRPLLVFPEPDGLLAWGKVPTGLSMTWKTSGSPDTWPVVISDDTSLEVDTWTFDGTTTEFLLEVLSNAVQVPYLQNTGYEPRSQPHFASFARDNTT